MDQPSRSRRLLVLTAQAGVVSTLTAGTTAERLGEPAGTAAAQRA